jgi:hypothetical protein
LVGVFWKPNLGTLSIANSGFKSDLASLKEEENVRIGGGFGVRAVVREALNTMRPKDFKKVTKFDNVNLKKFNKRANETSRHLTDKSAVHFAKTMKVSNSPYIKVEPTAHPVYVFERKSMIHILKSFDPISEFKKFNKQRLNSNPRDQRFVNIEEISDILKSRSAKEDLIKILEAPVRKGASHDLKTDYEKLFSNLNDYTKKDKNYLRPDTIIVDDSDVIESLFGPDLPKAIREKGDAFQRKKYRKKQVRLVDPATERAEEINISRLRMAKQKDNERDRNLKWLDFHRKQEKSGDRTFEEIDYMPKFEINVMKRIEDANNEYLKM